MSHESIENGFDQYELQMHLSMGMYHTVLTVYSKQNALKILQALRLDKTSAYYRWRVVAIDSISTRFEIVDE